jgi:hypothetical protein
VIARRSWSMVSPDRPDDANALPNSVPMTGSSLRRAALSRGGIASVNLFCISRACPRSCAAGMLLRSAFNTSDAERSASSGRRIRSARIARSSAGWPEDEGGHEGGRLDIAESGVQFEDSRRAPSQAWPAQRYREKTIEDKPVIAAPAPLRPDDSAFRACSAGCRAVERRFCRGFPALAAQSAVPAIPKQNQSTHAFRFDPSGRFES